MNFKKMTFLCMQRLTNFPYIEEDFDALTNYELLCKVVEYLNKVIANENNQNEAINELAEAFTNLKNYVDNLDLQDEVNNKLDEMYENGQLEQIIEQLLQSTAIWCFDTVADMKLATNLINGSYTKTLGYYELNDGGGAIYKIRNKTNEDIIDNGSLISLSDLLVAELVSSKINYNQFGAYGDGTHDDFQAIYNAHVYANNHNLNIEGVNKSTYLIGDHISIPVKTNTDLKNSTVIIDDRNISHYNYPVYAITSNYENIDKTSSVMTLSKGQTYIQNLAGNGNCLALVKNSYVKNYIRSGENANLGDDLQDLFRIDNSGYVIDSIEWDFNVITSLILKPIDEKTLYFKNGNFITKANNEDSEKYYLRNIETRRSNVIIENINHSITDELTDGSPYFGFISTREVANIIIRNCNLQAHKIYYTGSNIAIGSYDIENEHTINLKYENIYQTNDINNSSDLWAIHGLNYCKNVEFSNCYLNHIDSHKQLVNIDINNCIIGNYNISLLGFGTANIKNTKVINSDVFVRLRSDFGASWNGTLNIENCEMIDNRTTSSSTSRMIVQFYNSQNHNYGYKCYLPDLNINNFKYNGINNSRCAIIRGGYVGTGVNIDYTATYDENVQNNVYPLIFMKNINCKNLTVSNSTTRFSLVDDISLMKYYCENIGSFITNSSPRLNYNTLLTNCNITLDNVDFGNVTNQSIGWNYSSLFNNSYDSNTSYTNNYHLYPYIIIKNCNYLFLGVRENTGLYDIDNCEIYKIRCGESNNNAFSVFNIKNSKIIYYYQTTPTWSNRAFCLNPKNIILNNCTFELGENVTLAQIFGQDAPFFNLKTYVNYFLSEINYHSLKYWNSFETDLLSIEGYNNLVTNYGINIDILYNNNPNYKPRVYGATSERPANFNDAHVKIPVGSVYYDTTLSSFVRYNGTSWI